MKIPRYVGAGIAGAAVLNTLHTSGRVRRQNSPFRRYWERHLVHTCEDLTRRHNNGEERPLIYVALGDSAAQGLGATSIREGYVPRVAQALSEATGREVALLNLSLSGGTVLSVLSTQLPQLAGLRIGGEPIKPDVVTLDIGSNDVGQQWMSEPEFSAHYYEMVTLLPQETHILNVPSFGMLKIDERARAFSQIVDDIVVTEGHHLVDIRHVSTGMPVTKYVLRYHAPDMFHPNSPWYEVWAQLLMDSISTQRGWEPIDVSRVAPWAGPVPIVI